MTPATHSANLDHTPHPATTTPEPNSETYAVKAATPQPRGTTTPDTCHIRVHFDRPPLEFDYQDDRTVALRFAHALTGLDASVTIDIDLRENLPPLPCRQLCT